MESFTAAIKSTGENCPAHGTSMDRVCNAITTDSDTWIGRVAQAGKQAAALKTESVQATKVAAVEASSVNMYSAIGYSVIAILIIVLVMIILYLILRYRRKKKMNKKLHYTKLLKQ
ncbi:hypothetical protein PFMC_05255 [Plasmodium falciparum CAMP/Malaysia]|uniref:Rifin n=1 Tax=Plasmodium falciparum (isolate Camp / Malaysia) TaxID=5835 RepID=A0A024X027_PLAFC|nr:hypothetical protein PFMC_05255 [Plasmodium falciparum CAMP/Malaysia]